MRRCLLPLVLSLAVLAGACGSGDDSGSEPTTAPTEAPAATVAVGAVSGACDLLTQVDVEAAFGEPVVPGTQSTDECWWSTANDLKTVNLVRRTGDLEAWRSGYDNDFWEPNDLGDEGYSGKALNSIVWRVGETQYEINVVFSTKGEPDEVVRVLAEQAAARL
jgi:hypothetical protein